MSKGEKDPTFGKFKLTLMLHNPWFAQNDSAIFATIYHLEIGLAWQSLDIEIDKSTAMGGYSLLLEVVEAFKRLHFSFAF